MKKAYNKPEIVFDSFELSQNIAAGCEFISNHSKKDCSVTDPSIGMTFFTRSTYGCVITEVPGNYDDICYDVPNPSNNVFTS